ncbi:hypothetical protein LXD69_09320 [Flavobacterium sediminilitoris]|uniref:Lipoprotein n=1 Tax=Flavobacterium sediminilitoris TaxID=2024526 RepID=A0ABY4HHS0_9FLAO|nr:MULTISPECIES: hypothetical protein [Flavobacterium]UOX32253.1 hypothetical protein LXD69_09320 [Flavobacterium sediminilitoris]
MKKIHILIIFFTLYNCSSTTTTIPNKLDSIYIINAKNFAFTQFESCSTGNYIPITNKIATPNFARKLTINNLAESCVKINDRFGTLLNLEIQQALIYKKTLIYRFKATYSKIKHNPEIRVYSTLEHKYSGLIIKPKYLEKYTPFKPETKI